MVKKIWMRYKKKNKVKNLTNLLNKKGYIINACGYVILKKFEFEGK